MYSEGLCVAADRLTASELLRCLEVCHAWVDSLLCTDMDAVWSSAAAIQGLVFISALKPGATSTTVEPAVRTLHALQRWRGLQDRFNADAENLVLDCPLAIERVDQRPVPVKPSMRCEICETGGGDTVTIPGQRLTHAQEVMWEHNGYHNRFDVVAFRQQKAGSPSAVLELRFSPPSNADDIAEFCMTLTTIHNLPFVPSDASSSTMLLGLHRAQFSFYGQHARCSWCECLPTVAFRLLLDLPQYQALRGHHVLVHDTSGNARTDEQAMRQIVMLQGVSREAGWRGTELTFCVPGHPAQETYDRLGVTKLHEELNIHNQGRPRLFAATGTPSLTSELKYRVRSHPPRSGVCDHCNKQGGDKKLLVCSRCKGAAFCDAKCQKAAWKRHKRGCEPPLQLCNPTLPCEVQPGIAKAGNVMLDRRG